MNKKSTLIIVLILAVLIAGFFINSARNAKENVSSDIPEIIVKSKVYFGDSTGSSLVGENVEFTVSHDSLKYQESINKLIKGPEGETFFRTVNADTKVNGITVSNGTCVIDFSESFITYNTGGTLRELLCIYSIVNTLCEFDEIEKVEFTVNGEKIKTFGQMDMTEPFVYDKSIVK